MNALITLRYDKRIAIKICEAKTQAGYRQSFQTLRMKEKAELTFYLSLMSNILLHNDEKCL